MSEDNRAPNYMGMDLPQEGLSLALLERSLLLQALERTAWNMTHAAKLLGLSWRTMQYRVQKFGLSRPTHFTAPQKAFKIKLGKIGNVALGGVDVK